MVKLYQTKHGDRNDNPSEQGNCFQACLASIFEQKLDDTINISMIPSQHNVYLDDQPWFIAVNKWLEQFGLSCVYIEVKDGLCMTKVDSYYIGEFNIVGQRETHACVCRGYDLIHDPIKDPPYMLDHMNMVGMYLFVPGHKSTENTKRL